MEPESSGSNGRRNLSTQDIQSKKSLVKRRLLREAEKFFIIVAYLWVVLVLLELHRLAVLRQVNLTERMDYKLGFALINALVLGKVILLGDELRLAERLFKAKRLIYTVLFKSFVFATVLLIFEIVEEVIVGMLHGKTFVASIPQMGGGGMEGKLIVVAIMFAFCLPFFGFRELREVVGKDQMRSMIFTKRSAA